MATAQQIKPDDRSEAENADLAAEFSKFQRDLEALKRDIASLTQTGAQEVREEAKRRMNEAEMHAHEALDAASNEVQEIQRQAEKAVRKNPLTAMGAALAIGYFIASLRK
ncbi:MAG: hypothetical protein AAGD92_06610 [Pseudomonadota bacterium]